MPKQLAGTIISNKMKNTVVVEVERFVKHPRYKKIMKRISKLKAHTEKQLEIGDKVVIEECKPIAKSVNFVVKG